MNLDSNVDFTQIALQTEGFTGADLQSILYSAQLKAVEEHQLKSAGESCFEMCLIFVFFNFILNIWKYLHCF